MRLTSLRLENWRNFRRAEVPMARRVFLVGPNASGKSNLLDEDRARRYRLEFNQDNKRRAVVRHETVWDGDQQVLSRPDAADLSDPQLLTQTHLEQVNTKRVFRPVADFLSRVRALHLVPQLVQDRDRYVRREGSRTARSG